MLIDKTKETRDLIDTRMHLIKGELPRLSLSDSRHRPVCKDHCLRQIVLDMICGGVWYEHLGRPVYKHLTNDQAQRAVDLCHSILAVQVDLYELNHQSLVW